MNGLMKIIRQKDLQTEKLRRRESTRTKKEKLNHGGTLIDTDLLMVNGEKSHTKFASI